MVTQYAHPKNDLAQRSGAVSQREFRIKLLLKQVFKQYSVVNPCSTPLSDTTGAINSWTSSVMF